MHGLASPAYWLIRRLTGYRLYHLVAVLLVVVATIGALAIPFWQLAELAEGVAGFAGLALVALAYLYTAVLVLAAAAVLVGGLVIRRVRNLLSTSLHVRLPG